MHTPSHIPHRYIHTTPPTYTNPPAHTHPQTHKPTLSEPYTHPYTFTHRYTHASLNAQTDNSPPSAYINRHTRVHAYRNTLRETPYTYMLIPQKTHTQTQAETNTQWIYCTLKLSHTSPTLILSKLLSYTQTQSLSELHTLIRIQTHIWLPLQIATHAHLHIQTHSHTYTHIHMHTHMRTINTISYIKQKVNGPTLSYQKAHNYKSVTCFNKKSNDRTPVLLMLKINIP